MRFLLLLVFVTLSCGSEDQLFGSSAFLKSYLAKKRLADLHVGVAFDIFRGVPFNMPLFSKALFDIDPLAAKSLYDIKKLRNARDVHELKAKTVHVDYVPGMFVKAPMPHYVPPANGSCFLSTRTDVLLVIKLKARSMQKHMLMGSLLSALESLPDTYDELDTLPWTNFFSVFPTHFTESALVGGRILVSSLTKTQGAMSDLDVKEAIDEILHGGHTKMAHFLKWTQDRVVVSGGDTMALSGSLRGFSSAKHSVWMETLQKAPTVVGYTVRPLSDLLDGKRREAMKFAIEAHLEKGYQTWRKEVVKHDEIVKLMEVSRDSLENQVEDLKLKKLEVARRLADSMAQVATCEAEGQTLQTKLERCKAEAKAFQKSLIECDTRNFQKEHIFDALYACEAKKKIAGCVGKQLDSTSNRGRGRRVASVGR